MKTMELTKAERHELERLTNEFNTWENLELQGKIETRRVLSMLLCNQYPMEKVEENGFTCRAILKDLAGMSNDEHITSILTAIANKMLLSELETERGLAAYVYNEMAEAEGKGWDEDEDDYMLSKPVGQYTSITPINTHKFVVTNNAIYNKLPTLTQVFSTEEEAMCVAEAIETLCAYGALNEE